MAKSIADIQQEIRNAQAEAIRQNGVNASTQKIISDSKSILQTNLQNQAEAAQSGSKSVAQSTQKKDSFQTIDNTKPVGRFGEERFGGGLISPAGMDSEKRKEIDKQIQNSFAQKVQEEAKKPVTDADIAAKDIEQLSKWADEDRKLLDDYITEKDKAEDPQMRNNFIYTTIHAMKVDKAKKELEKKYGEEAVRNLAETRGRQLHSEQAEKAQDETKAMVNSGIAGAVGANVVGSLARNVGGVYGSMGRLPEMSNRTGRYSTLEQYTPGDITSLIGSTVQSETAKNIAGEDGGMLRKAAAIGYQGVVSAVDSLARAVTLGKASLALAGLNAFSSTMSEATAKGASPEQAAGLATIDAAVEVLTEYLPTEQIINLASGNASAAGKVIAEGLKLALGEPLEEEVGLIANLAAEAAILQDKSEYRQTVQSLMAEGKTEEEARKIANESIWQQVKETAAVSLVSGVFSAGVSSGMGRIAGRGADTDVQNQYDTPGAVATQTQNQTVNNTIVSDEAAQTAVNTSPNNFIQQTAEQAAKNNTQNTPVENILVSAINEQAETGKVTNKTVENILSDPETMQMLGVETNGKTKAEIRNDIKAAVAAMQQEVNPASTQAQTVNNPDVETADQAVTNTQDQDITRQQQEQQPTQPEQPTQPPTQTGEGISPDRQLPGENNPVQPFNPSWPDGSSVAAQENFSGKPAYNATLTENNAQPDRASDVRPMELPQTDINGNRVSAVTGNVYGSKITTDELAGLIEEPVARGDFSVVKMSNDEATQRASDTIAKAGNWETASRNFAKEVGEGKAGAEMSARGAILLNHYAEIGDKVNWMNTLHDLQQLGTNTAQGLQAMRIIRNLTPVDKIEFAKQSIQRMVDNLKLKNQIELPESLISRFEAETTDSGRDAAMDDIMQYVADEIMNNMGVWRKLSVKFNALRHINMLGNLKTNVRNVAGNVGSWLNYRTKDAIGAVIEKGMSAAGSDIDRTKSLFVDKDRMRVAVDDFNNAIGVKDATSSGGRYTARTNDMDAFTQGVMDRRQIFKNPLLEGYRKATGWAMNNQYFGDEAFCREGYSRALAGYLKANGVTAQQWTQMVNNDTDTEFVFKAREYAVKQAQEATFHDNSVLAQKLSAIQKQMGIVGQGKMPYVKTPANVLLRSEEFSPLGFINTAVKVAQKANGNVNISGTDIVDSLAKNLTGTGLFLLGMVAQSQGIVTAGADEDDEKAAFDKMNGIQTYSVKLNILGKTYTMDWLTPSCMSFFMGAEFNKIKDEIGFENATFADYEKAFTSLAEPMMKMSMMQGIDDTFSKIKYSDNQLLQLAIDSCVSYLTQGLTNQMLGQIERGMDEYRQTTYIDKDSWIPTWMQQQLGKVSQAIPGWDYQQQDYLDAFGEKQKNVGGSKLGRVAYNMLSPGYLQDVKDDKLTQELYRLGEVGYNAFPDSAKKQISYTTKDGEIKTNFNLSGEQWSKLQTIQGSTAKRNIAAVINNETYKAMPDDLKKAVIDDIYTFSKETALQQTISDYYSGDSDAWIEQAKSNPVGTIVNRVLANSLKSNFENYAKRYKNNWDIPQAVTDSVNNSFDAFDTLSDKQKKQVIDIAVGDTAKALAMHMNADISANDFVRIFKDTLGLDVEDGYSKVRAVQELESIAADKKFTDAQKDAALSPYMTNDNNDARYQYTRNELGLSPEIAIRAYRIISDSVKENGLTLKGVITRDLQKSYEDGGAGLSQYQAWKVYQAYKSQGFTDWKKYLDE